MTGHQTKLITIMFLLLVTIAIFVVAEVSGDVPSVNSITPWKRQTDNHTFLNITVTHNGYFSGHYVNRVQTDLGGTVRDFTITATSPVDQTRTSTFVVPIDLGVISGTPTVKTRAYCNIHGPSALSNAVEIPEFPIVQIVFIIAFLMAVVIFNHKTRAKNTSLSEV